jgi:E3 ubiquitin-protein ligase RNF139
MISLLCDAIVKIMKENNTLGGVVRAMMLLIHSYFNIWCEARAGWNVYMKRRTAVQKISSLPEATSAELENFDDVCAICYQEMHTAKITRCRHYFHGVCLRKWLYVQDKVRIIA